MNGGLLFTSVSPGANPNRPGLRFDYTTRVKKYDWDLLAPVDPEITHKECAFVTALWCGDGKINGNETCDNGAQNGQPGKCNTTCNGVISGYDCSQLHANGTSKCFPICGDGK